MLGMDVLHWQAVISCIVIAIERVVSEADGPDRMDRLVGCKHRKGRVFGFPVIDRPGKRLEGQRKG